MVREEMSDCTNCILDLTDACQRGAGRAIDDEICESFMPRETYQVNKNESWQLGYHQGRADAIEEYVSILKKELEFCEKHGDLVVKLAEQLKEQKNE